MTAAVEAAIEHPVRRFGDRNIDLSRRIAVMAVVNRTPDSFYDQGATFALDAAVAAGAAAFEAGADLVDVGGVKFAPGPPLPIDEECERVIPLVRELAQLGAVSVDTFQPEVARRAIAAGAAVINDTTGVHDPAMADVVADSDATLVVAHSRASPRTQLPMPHYDDVVAEVRAFLDERVALAESRGVPRERLIIDPGHDLNKNTRHSLELTRRLGELANSGLPLLVALSNKDFIGESLGRARDERLPGSLAAAVYCALQGARLLRVHNVRESVDAARMVESIWGWRDPVALVHNMRPEGNE